MIRGRAFITADNAELFYARDSRKFLQSMMADETTAGKKLSDRYYLWLPHFCSDDEYGVLWSSPTDIIGYILLEGVWRIKLKNCAATPIGLLYFHSGANIKEIVNGVVITNRDLQNGDLSLRWLSPREAFWLDHQLERDLDTRTLKWGWIDKVARDTWFHPRPELKNVFSDICEVIHIGNWNFMGLLSEWSRRQNLWNTGHAQVFNSELTECDQQRHLRLCEYIYMFFHISLRWRMDRSEVARVLTIGMSGMVLPIDTVNDELCVSAADERAFNKNDNINEHHAMTLASIGWEKCRIEQCTHMISLLFDRVARNAITVADKVCVPLERARQRYASFQLFISDRINQIMQLNTLDIPPSLFDTDSVSEWATNRGSEIEKIFQPRNLLAVVYECVNMNVKTDQLLRLYGNLNVITRSLNERAGDDACEYLYYPVNVSKLSAVPFKPQRFIGCQSEYPPPFDMPITEMGKPESVKRLEEASAFCTPIWFEWHPNDEVPNFMTVRAVEIGKDRVPDNLPDAPVNMFEFLKPDTGFIYKSGGYSYEYINSRMHLSTILIDCDLKLLDTTRPLESIDQTARDMVELVEIVMERLRCVLQGSLKHYIFYSKPQEDTTHPSKCGFHHHIVIPPGFVFSTAAGAELIKMLNVVRFIFPNTIGRDCGAVSNESVYDPCIYGRSGGGVRGHGLRGPGQRKPDGTKELICIHRTDGEALQSSIPISALYAHGPQFDAAGKPVAVGTVIDRLVGAQSLEDVEFHHQTKNQAVNVFTEKRCGHTVRDIMRELNHRTYIFNEEDTEFPTASDRALLLECINSLWDLKGRNILSQHMCSTRGNENCTYPPRVFSSAIPTTKFVIHGGTIKLVSTGYEREGNLPYCPNRPHRRKPRGVVVELVFKRGMVVFGLRVRCRKASCDANTFHKDVLIPMQKDFIAAPIHKAFVYDFLPLFEDRNAVDVVLPTLIRSGDNENLIYEILPIRTDNASPYIDYISGTDDIMYMYAFTNQTNGVAIFRTKNNNFVALIAAERRLIIATRICAYLMRYLEKQNTVSAPVLRKIGAIMTRDGQDIGF